MELSVFPVESRYKMNLDIVQGVLAPEAVSCMDVALLSRDSCKYITQGAVPCRSARKVIFKEVRMYTGSSALPGWPPGKSWSSVEQSQTSLISVSCVELSFLCAPVYLVLASVIPLRVLQISFDLPYARNCAKCFTSDS